MAATRYHIEAGTRSVDRRSLRGDWVAFDAARCAVASNEIGDDSERANAAEVHKQNRSHALAWIQEDLQKFDKLLAADEGGAKSNVRWSLMKLKTTPALAGVRDEALLEQLPEDERAQWRTLWADADSVSVRARSH